MKGLSTDVYSHLSLETEVRTSNSVVRLSRATGISSYADLVKAVAKIQFGNPEYSLFFRGQDKDYTLDSGSSTMYPSIYRKSGLSVDELREQMNKLDYAANLLLKEFRANNLLGYNRLADFIELCWAVLQHYEVCETPLLDLTSSLQAAASFALRHKTATGYLFVLGFPHVNGSISYYVEEALINIKLLSICPPVGLMMPRKCPKRIQGDDDQYNENRSPPGGVLECNQRSYKVVSCYDDHHSPQRVNTPRK